MSSLRLYAGIMNRSFQLNICLILQYNGDVTLLVARVGELLGLSTARSARSERIHIRNNVDFSADLELVLVAVTTTLFNVVSELEVENTPTSSRSLARGSVDGSVLRSDDSGGPVQVLVATDTRGTDASEQTEITTSSADGVRRPHDNLLGTSARDGNYRGLLSSRSGLVQVPAQVTRTAQVVADHADE
jgi:hypothetical protein